MTFGAEGGAAAPAIVMAQPLNNTVRGRVVACHDCGTLHRIGAVPPGHAARCGTCGGTLWRQHHDGIRHALMLTLAGAILFAISNSYPILTMRLEGRESQNTILSGVWALYQHDMVPLALLVLGVIFAVPLLNLIGNLYVLVPLSMGRRPWKAAAVLQIVEGAHPWAMLEVYLLGVIVAYVKLADLAAIDPGIALFAFVALIVTLIAADSALDPCEAWERLAPQATTASLGARGRSLVSCHGCGQIVAAPAHSPPNPTEPHGFCPRCGAALHVRKPNSLNRTWALILTAVILYVPANLLPVMTVVSFGKGEPDTILSGVQALAAVGMWPVAILVFFASITVPVLKLIGLSFLLISVQRRSAWRRRDRTVLYRIVENVGRWSMVDIFMISILTALVNLQAIATIDPGPGAIAFAAVVVITMIASYSFDPRLIWDAAEHAHGRRQTVRI